MLSSLLNIRYTGRVRSPRSQSSKGAQRGPKGGPNGAQRGPKGGPKGPGKSSFGEHKAVCSRELAQLSLKIESGKGAPCSLPVK